MRTLLLTASLITLAVDDRGAPRFAIDSAHAQPMRRMERDRSAGQLNRSAGHKMDDVRDLRRYQATLAAFDAAMQRRDPVGIRGALQSFVAQGRAEVAEEARETAQAAREAGQAVREAQRDRTVRDARDARDDRRDLRQQQKEQYQDEVILSELERLAAAEISFGPQAGIVLRARGLMVRFTQLQRAEIRRDNQEIREDRRELREDQRNLRRGPRY